MALGLPVIALKTDNRFEKFKTNYWFFYYATYDGTMHCIVSNICIIPAQTIRYFALLY